MAQPLMPHATASWLVDNTSLSFQQIAEFCGLHILEIQAIADDTAQTKLTGRDPLRAHELTQDEIDKGQADPNYKPVPLGSTVDREWFFSQSEALFKKKITKEQYMADGAKQFPGYEASFAELADLLTA